MAPYAVPFMPFLPTSALDLNQEYEFSALYLCLPTGIEKPSHKQA